MVFSVDIINCVEFVKSNHESVIANQIGRSGTFIGANMHEASYAQGNKNFISKLPYSVCIDSSQAVCVAAFSILN